MTNPTTEELKDLLGKVSQGEWHFGKDCEAGLGSGFFVAGGGAVLADLRSSNQMHNATLIALAPTLAAEVVRLREALARRAVKDIQGLVDWLSEDEYNAELLLDNLTDEQIETARQALSQK